MVGVTELDHTPLSPELLLTAYRNGLFPMADGRDDPDVFWVDPRMRGIIPLDAVHISRSLARTIRQDRFVITLDAYFSGVVQGCADRPETWINDPIQDLYAKLHNLGFAHSVEVWHQKTLVGGVYGVAIGGCFFGESMFSAQRDASKVALVWLLTHLRDCGFQLFDTQFLTPHLATLGAIEISRKQYHSRLKNALLVTADIHSNRFPMTGYEVMQRRAHTS